ADRNRSHWSTSKTPSYTKSVSWQHHRHRLWWCFSCLVLLKIFSDIYYLRESFTPHLSIHSLEI
ncbi:hypothetical protein, partial [Escherichia coli]|uniref:hypothetical protein n=1 Tax=Escherichia coli TaxID=562 RepID=UPI001BFECC79